MNDSPRELSLVDCVGLGLNSIIGSGIYLLMAPLAATAGAASVTGIVCCGGLLVLIALCYAELGAAYPSNGGSFVFAREAFGPAVGFAVGWMGFLNTVLGYAAVAVGFSEALARMFPALLTPIAFSLTGRMLVGWLLIGTLTFINALGLKRAAWTSDVLSAIKLLPLVGLALFGLAALDPSVFAALGRAPEGRSYLGAVSGSAFLSVFMLSGFEYVAVPGGEVRSAHRNLPIAILGSLLGATLLYVLLQLAALSVLPGLATREHPLMALATTFWGRAGGALVGAASLVSMAGFCAGSALVAPRYATALAERGHLPAGLAHVTAAGSPRRAIMLVGACAAVLSFAQTYAALVDVANIAVFAQYIPTCLAVLVLRRRRPDLPRPFQLSLGPLVPLFATAASIALLISARPKAREWLSAGAMLAIGFVVWALTSQRRAR